jgi:hypothetical protein
MASASVFVRSVPVQGNSIEEAKAVPQPQFGDRRWFMNHPFDACPEWANNDVPEEAAGGLAALASHRWQQERGIGGLSLKAKTVIRGKFKVEHR